MTRYSSTTIDAIKGGSAMGRQEEDSVQNTSFDIYGNALDQTITKTYYDSDGVTTLLGNTEYMKIANTFDSRNRVSASVIDNYPDSTFSALSLVTEKIVSYSGYDDYSNATDQTIKTYIGKDRVFSTLETIHSDFGADPAQRMKGNAVTRTVSKYSDEAAAALVTRSVINTTSFDSFGNPLVQDSVTSRSSGAGMVDIRVTHTVNLTFDSAGNALTQQVTTYSALDPSKAISYELVTNLSFDSNHNVTSQIVLTYTKESGVFVSAKEIRYDGFDSTGTPIKEYIATYQKDDLSDTPNVTVVFN